MIKTVKLNQSEICVDGLEGYNTVITNLGSSTVYASRFPNIVAGKDNVITIPANSRDGLSDTNGKIYLLGDGVVELRGVPYSANFNSPSSSNSLGGGGTSDVTKQYVDTEINKLKEVIKEAGIVDSSTVTLLIEPYSDNSDLTVVDETGTEYSLKNMSCK